MRRLFCSLFLVAFAAPIGLFAQSSPAPVAPAVQPTPTIPAEAAAPDAPPDRGPQRFQLADTVDPEVRAALERLRRGE
jgi:hypothetical protein